MSWRPATNEEIHAYYAEEFPAHLDDLPSFITPTGPKQYAIAFREPHPIRKADAPDRDFIRRDTWDTNRDGERTTPTLGDIESVVEFIRYPARNDPLDGSDSGLVDPDLIEKGDPKPDAVYYALEHWERPWVLLVDIDAKEIAHERAAELIDDPDGRTEDELLFAAGITATDPVGYPYAFEDVERALEYGFEVADIFEDDFNAQETMVVYSGQGCHVYLLDSDPAHHYDAKSREVLNDLLLEHYEIPIDPVVTADRRRVARLPHSLHTEVSRIVQPIENADFDFRQDAKPEFLT